MTKHLIYIALSALMVLSCQHKTGSKLNGAIENSNDKMLYLERMDLSKNVIVDSIKLTQSGKFTFNEKCLEPTFYRLKFNDANFITLLVDTCSTIEINANGENLLDDYTVKNSLESNHIKILDRRLRATQQALDSLSEAFSKLRVDDMPSRERIQQLYLEAINNHKKFIADFVMENPYSFTSYYALFQKLNNDIYIMDVNDKEDRVCFSTIATSLNILYPEAERVKHLYQFVLSATVQQRKQDEMNQLFEKANVGIPEIEESTIDGNLVKLSSLRGKIVLLSFWASWDANSRKENGHLKNVYQKFKHKGFEIYQVSLDKSKILWELAIQNDGCSWINVSDLRYTDSYPAKAYNINQLPSNFLINQQGEIIGKNLFGNRLVEKLDELLN